MKEMEHVRERCIWFNEDSNDN